MSWSSKVAELVGTAGCTRIAMALTTRTCHSGYVAATIASDVKASLYFPSSAAAKFRLLRSTLINFQELVASYTDASIGQLSILIVAFS
jgi:hypothetical protein